MEYDAQLKLQAYLDGELPEAEAREVARWLAEDREAVGLLGELRNTRQALVGVEIGVTLPESREFFWSKIEREIRAQPQPEPASSGPSWLSAWRRFLVPAGAMAALALAVMFGLPGGAGVSAADTAFSDPGAFTYHDFDSKTTLVWFSYPADEEDSEIATPAAAQ